MARSSATAIARRIKRAELLVPDLLREVADPGDRLALLAELSRSKDAIVRMWVIAFGPDVVGAASIPIIEDLVRDHDGDVKAEALRSLSRLAPERASRDVPRILRWLRSPDYLLPVDAMWLLAELRAADAIPAIEQAKETWAEDPWKVRLADIVLHVLRGEDEPIAHRIRYHDHVDLPRLARAARILGTPLLHDALRACRDDRSVDDECRSMCEEGFGALPWNPTPKPT